MTRPAIVLDCDPGVDDAIAILCALRYADLVGITTVNGNVSIDKTTRNALVVTECAGVDVPVHRGCAEPLVPHLLDAGHVHGADGLGGMSIEPARGAAGDDAVGYLLELVRARDDIHLVAVGPLTNLALAVRRDPTFVSRLRSLTVMGGAATGGNVTASAEFNIHVDPEAAAIVYASGTIVRTVPLDLTHQVIAGPAHVEAVRAGATPTAALVAALYDHLDGVRRAASVLAAGALHDPCAVLSVTHPELFGFVRGHVEVELDGRLTRGMTVLDRRPGVRLADVNAAFGTTVDAPAVLQLVLDAAIDPIGPGGAA